MSDSAWKVLVAIIVLVLIVGGFGIFLALYEGLSQWQASFGEIPFQGWFLLVLWFAGAFYSGTVAERFCQEKARKLGKVPACGQSYLSGGALYAVVTGLSAAAALKYWAGL